jgi:hypothetical protein
LLEILSLEVDSQARVVVASRINEKLY